MKKIIPFLLVFVCHSLIAQEWYNDTSEFESVAIENALKKQFATLYNSNLGNGLGSFASLSIKDAKVEFSGNHRFKKGDVLGLKVTGGVSDNVTTIFSNTKWNSNFGMDISYNFFWNNRIGKEFMPYRVEVLDDKLTSTWITVNERALKTDVEVLEFEVEYQKLISELDSLKKKSGKSPSTYAEAQIRLLQFKVDSYDKQMKENQLRLKLADTLKVLKTSIKAEKFRVNWLSLSYGLNSNGFKRIDPTLGFADQVWKESFVTHKIRAQYQWYSTGSFKEKEGDVKPIMDRIANYFFAVYLEGGEKDNFSSLTDVDIVEKTEFGPSADVRSSTDKYTAYSGDYKKGIQFINLGTDFYWFLFNEGKVGLHLSPKYRGAEGLQPEFDFLTGFYASFVNEEKDGPRVNVELFLNFTNLMKYNDRDIEPNHFKRATYGLSFTMPIKFNWE